MCRESTDLLSPFLLVQSSVNHAPAMHWVLPFLGLTGRLSVFVSDSTISTLAKRDAIVNVNLNAKRQIPAMASNQPDDFKWQEGADVFTPLDLVQLPRPGAGVANDAGDLVLVPVSQYSSQDKECVTIMVLSCGFVSIWRSLMNLHFEQK